MDSRGRGITLNLTHRVTNAVLTPFRSILQMLKQIQPYKNSLYCRPSQDLSCTAIQQGPPQGTPLKTLYKQIAMGCHSERPIIAEQTPAS